jgi:general secretion pathway protein J
MNVGIEKSPCVAVRTLRMPTPRQHQTNTRHACQPRHPRHPRRKQSAFTLLEMLLAITLLAMMMSMIYASLNVGIRAWDAGDSRVAEGSNWRMVERFLRRELGQVFPTRWRGVPQPNVAFEGTQTSLRYVTSLNLDAALQNGSAGGLQWAELALVEGGVLQLNRQPFDSAAADFGNLAAPSSDELASNTRAAPVKLMDGIRGVEFGYFGADTDLGEPTWRSEWRDVQRLPLLIRLQITNERGRDVPTLVVAPKVGEEAGCLQSNFTRQCGSRVR